MGNYVSNRSSCSVGKVIQSDGTVYEFDESLTVAELMLEHPQQVVVEFRPSMSGKRPSPLPADMKLEVQKVYLMLPKKKGKVPTLSSNEARRALLVAQSLIRSGPVRFLPFLTRICPAHIGAEHGPAVFNDREELVESKEEMTKPEFSSEIMDGRPDYLSRQLSGRGWKPSLDTIKEKKIERKVTHWLF